MCSRNITAGISGDDVDHLQSLENIDPEIKPGLFQGDMALNNEVSRQRPFNNYYNSSRSSWCYYYQLIAKLLYLLAY